MRVDTSFKNMEKNNVLEATIEKDLTKLEGRLDLFKNKDPIHVSLHLEKNPHKEQYLCWINLYMPFKVLKSHCSGGNTCTVINNSFAALLKQLDKFRQKLENHSRKKTDSVEF